MPRTSTTLTAREQRFVLEMLNPTATQTEAAIRAGYSDKDAARRGCLLMKKSKIRAAITKGLAEQQKRTLITADKVLLDIQNIGTEAWKAKDYGQALRSRELIGKRYKLFTDRMEVIDTTPRAERLQAARARKKQDGE